MNERDLTPAQLTVLNHFARGYTLHETALSMRVKPQTVKNHAKDAFARLKVKNRWAAFVALGWLTPPELR